MNAQTLAVGASELRMPWKALRIATLLAALLAGTVAAVQMTPYINRPLTQIRVDGHFAHLSPGQIAAVAAIAPGTRLFNVDLQQVRERVEALPWVGHARVFRAWPDGVTLRVDERQPVALWGPNGLLDAEGREFVPPAADLPQGLPQLEGPDDRIDDVWSAYQIMAAALADGPFALAGMTLDARGDWTAHTRGGITLQLGQNDPVAQLPLIKGAVTHSLQARIGEVAYVDLRYPNGFAVGWRNAAGQARAPNAGGTR